jgi:hypothetical protein
MVVVCSRVICGSVVSDLGVAGGEGSSGEDQVGEGRCGRVGEIERQDGQMRKREGNSVRSGRMLVYSVKGSKTMSSLWGSMSWQVELTMRDVGRAGGTMDQL